MKKNDKVLLIISIILFIISLIPLSEAMILGGAILSAIAFVVSIFMYIKEKSNVKFICILFLAVSLVTDITLYIYINNMI